MAMDGAGLAGLHSTIPRRGKVLKNSVDVRQQICEWGRYLLFACNITKAMRTLSSVENSVSLDGFLRKGSLLRCSVSCERGAGKRPS